MARSEAGLVLPPQPRELEREEETDELLKAPELLEPREQFDTETDNEPLVRTPDAVWEDPPPVLPESNWPMAPLRPPAEEPEPEELPVVVESVPVTTNPPAPVAVDRGPLLTHQPSPRYPRLAWRLGVEGAVEVRIHVRADGSVRLVEVLESSGSRQLDEAAQKALLDWRFEPAMRAGVAVAESYEHRVRFALQS